jgi:K+-sensing histidine kinase KdpD
MLLNNIMGNALNHARTRIKVSVSVSSGSVDLNIEDDGKGIPVAERSDVIKPFWRGSEEPVGRGHGMGLAIVARIAAWFDASLHIDESAELGGAAIHLRFRAAT